MFHVETAPEADLLVLNATTSSVSTTVSVMIVEPCAMLEASHSGEDKIVDSAIKTPWVHIF